MKNKSKLISALSLGTVAATVTPLVLVSTGCAKSGVSFACDDVQNFTPSIATHDKVTEPMSVIDGNKDYFAQLAKNQSMPDQEHKWGTSIIADLIPSLNLLLQMSVQGLVTEEPITITKIGANVKNFKSEEKNGKTIASYNNIEDINLHINMDFEWPKGREMPFTNISGDLRLAWNHKVNQMPLRFFDLDPSAVIGESKIFDYQTIWFMGPDPTQCDWEGKGSDDWFIDSTYLLNLQLSVDDSKVINIHNDTLNIRYDKEIQGIISSLGDKPLTQQLIMRLLPLTAGWSSYYMSQVEEAPHVKITWAPGQVIQATETSPMIAKTSIAKPFNGNVRIVDIPKDDPTYYSKKEFSFDFIPLDGDGSNGYSLFDINLFNSDVPFVIDYKSSLTEGSFAVTKVDWAQSITRPYDGYRWQENDRADLYDVRVVPAVITRDWIALGEPMILQEEATFGDNYVAHENKEGPSIEYVDVQDVIAQKSANGSVVLEFPIKDEDVYKDMQDDDHLDDYYVVVDSSKPIGKTPIAQIDKSVAGGRGWSVYEDKDKNRWLKIYLFVSEWKNKSTPPSEEAVTMDFNLLFEYRPTSLTQTVGPFVLRYGNGFSWNNKVDKIAAINANKGEVNKTELKKAIMFAYSGADAANLSGTASIKKSEGGTSYSDATATIGEPTKVDGYDNLYAADVIISSTDSWDPTVSPNDYLQLDCTIHDTASPQFTTSNSFDFAIGNSIIWNTQKYGNKEVPVSNTYPSHTYTKLIKFPEGSGIDEDTIFTSIVMEENSQGSYQPATWASNIRCNVNNVYKNFGDVYMSFDSAGVSQWYKEREQGSHYDWYARLKLQWIDADGNNHSTYINNLVPYTVS